MEEDGNSNRREAKGGLIGICYFGNQAQVT
jgi:hypothetical protein